MNELRDEIVKIIHNRLAPNISTDEIWEETNKLADSILALPEMKELMEKADKWGRATILGDFEILVNRSKDLSTIMSGLVVEEVTVTTTTELDSPKLYPDKIIGGTFTRPATAGEVREFIEWDFDIWNQELEISAGALQIRWCTDAKGLYFLLKSGGRMRLEK